MSCSVFCSQERCPCRPWSALCLPSWHSLHSKCHCWSQRVLYVGHYLGTHRADLFNFLKAKTTFVMEAALGYCCWQVCWLCVWVEDVSQANSIWNSVALNHRLWAIQEGFVLTFRGWSSVIAHCGKKSSRERSASTAPLCSRNSHGETEASLCASRVLEGFQCLLPLWSAGSS